MFNAFISISILLASIVYQANCADLVFTVTVVNNNLEIDCNYTLGNNEVYSRVVMRKDGTPYIECDKIKDSSE